MISEQEKIEIGSRIALLLQVKIDKRDRVTPKYVTLWGSKTPLGIYETVNEVIKDIKKPNRRQAI
jgi:hypothetical protein